MTGRDQTVAARKRSLRAALPARTLAVAATGAVAWSVAHAAEGEGHNGDLTRFLLSFSVILVAAKLGGEAFERMKQPTVLGELVFGILLGNAALVGIHWFDGLREAPFLAIAAEIGVILLLFQVGLETDIDELLAVGPSACLVAVLGVATPIALGFGASWLFMPADAEWYQHLFVGATLSATSIGITARVLQDIGVTRVRESRIILGAAIVDDVLGLIVLAVVLGLAHSADASGSVHFSFAPIAWIIVRAVGFLCGCVLVSRLIIRPLAGIVDRARSKSMGAVLSVGYCFTMAALAELVGLADIVGAFAAGIVIDDAISRHLGRDTARRRIRRAIHPIGALFVPVFFVYMGLRVDLHSLAFGEVLLFAGVLTVVAIASKQVCSLGVLEKGLNRWAVGVGMIPRGEVGLIFAGVGSTVIVGGLPVFGAETFSSIVAMVILTTLATPPLLKLAFAARSSGDPPRQRQLF